MQSPSRPPIVVAHAALLLGFLFGLQPVITDMFLPALPAIQRDLHASMAATQLTMSGMIFAFGCGQLVWGPVSDRYGRRPVLLLSLALLAAAGLASSLSTGMPMLVGWRIALGASLAAVVMSARAIVRDLYEPQHGALVMSKALGVLGLTAIVAPTIGGTAAALAGWRATLGCVFAIALVALLVVWRRLPETVPSLNPQALDPRAYLRLLREVAGHRTFRAYALLVAATYGGLFTFLASSSFVFIGVFGFTPARYGLMMAGSSISYLLGTMHCRRLLPRLGIAASVKRGALLSLAGGAALVLLALAGVQSPWAVIVPQYVYAFAHGIHQPCGQAGAVGPFPRAAGVASSLAGFMMSAVAVFTGLWLGHALDGSHKPLVYTMGFWAACTALVGLTLVQRHGSEALLAARRSPSQA